MRNRTGLRLALLVIAVLAAGPGCGGGAAPAQPRLSVAARNRLAGERWLEENRARPGVVATPSGLQYRVLGAGDGPRPGPRDEVRVHYTGRLIDGTVFDTSRDPTRIRGDAPAVFRVDQVIRGWTEALQLMPAGSRWELAIPSHLAYGLERAPKEIGPNQVLIFDVELLGVMGPSELK